MPTFATPEPIAVTVELALGDVHVIAGDRDDTVVAVNPSDRSRPADVEAASQTAVELDAGRLTVRAPRARGLGRIVGPNSRSGSIVVVIELPSGSHLQITSALGDVRADGRLGDVRVRVGAGSIHLDDTAAVELATGIGSVTIGRVGGDATIRGAGDVRIAAVDGHAQAKNLNGRTWVGEVTGDLHLRSSNGDITIERNNGRAHAKTANGNIRIEAVGGGSIDVATGSGRIDVGITADTAAWVDVHSRFGRITRDLDEAPPPDGELATAEIRARTSAGDIAIHHA